ncbi:MAG: ribonuclease E/G, partial [Bauldia sp.]
MANKMLVDAAHPEETRVVVLRGNRVEEFDFESASRKQLRGNIYLAKVTRVEPSLQAAFVDYGGNRHGFLAFSEIHPDYYQIPVADRQALIEAEEAEMAEAEARHADRERGRGRSGRGGKRPVAAADAAGAPFVSETAETDDAEHHVSHLGDDDGETVMDAGAADSGTEAEAAGDDDENREEAADGSDSRDDADNGMHADEDGGGADADDGEDADNGDGVETVAREASEPAEEGEVISDDEVDSVGAEDAMEEVPERRRNRVRQYKIQEVIKRRQVLLVQVVKEERGNKGAALTTYLSLAGRYCVLMPN